MDQSIQVLLSVPQFSIGARLLCTQKARELEDTASHIRITKVHAAAESEYHYAEKLNTMTLVSSDLLDPDSQVNESQFSELIAVLEKEL